MDPEANMTEQVAIARLMTKMLDSGNDGGVAWDACAERLAELVIALHEWRRGGGFDPYAAAGPLMQAARRSRASAGLASPEGLTNEEERRPCGS